MLKVTSLLVFGVRAWIEMGILCVTVMCTLKVVSSEENWLKGLCKYTHAHHVPHAKHMESLKWPSSKRG